MRKLSLIFLFAAGLMITNLKGQSIENIKLINGDWYACGLMSIQISDTVTFVRSDSTCKDKDCLYYKWIIYDNGKLKSGMQEGCEETKIVLDLKWLYKWTFDKANSLLNIKKKHSVETYKLLTVDDVSIKIIRIK